MSRTPLIFVATLLGGLVLPAPARARLWTDSTGKYQVNADLVAFSEKTVVLKKADHSLVAVPLDRLAKADLDFLAAKETADAVQSADALQTWTMRSGLKVLGKVVSYGRRDVVLQRRRGKIYVNDRLFDNLPAVQKAMVPKIVAHFEQAPIDDDKALQQWILKQKGEPRTFTCEGVMLELENGDEYGVPFFFFSDEDQKILRPGWDRWLAADKDRQKQDEEQFMVKAQAQAYQQDKQATQQIQKVQLELLAYNAGLFALWEVQLLPRTAAQQPMVVVVPGRNSADATNAALARYPGYATGAVAKVTRTY